MKKLEEGPLVVSAYPVAWRVEVVNDVEHRGFEYLRSEQCLALLDRGVDSHDVIASSGELQNGPGTLTMIQEKMAQKLVSPQLPRNHG